jgi:CO/xanthine dehydrogenase FAD-binding subunit
MLQLGQEPASGADHMDFAQPTNFDDALTLKAERPDALPIAGGTDVMIELNLDRRRPEIVLDLTRIAALSEVSEHDGWLRVGAGVTYAHVIAEFADRLPGLVLAARAIGSPSVRNRATIAGNLGSASPAGDCHPVLLACRAEVEAVSSNAGPRRIEIDEFFLGPRRNALRNDELIAATWLPTVSGPQQFSKVGRRNAMAESVCSFALTIDRQRGQIGPGIGSAGPTPLRAEEAETFLANVFDEDGLWESQLGPSSAALAHFGELVAAAASPIDDIRASAAYRRHALGVLATRTATWTRTEAVA